MNQKQREYLVDQVGKTYETQVKHLSEQRPTRPNLNNYLIAAFLDGSVQFNSLDRLKEKLRQRVLTKGSEEAIVSEKDDDGYSYNRNSRRRNSKLEQQVTVEAGDLFIFPPEYVEAMRVWKEHDDVISAKIDELDAHRKTIIMKIQIGSDKVLDKLIDQADNLADLNLINTQLTVAPVQPALGTGTVPSGIKRLSE